MIRLTNKSTGAITEMTDLDFMSVIDKYEPAGNLLRLPNGQVYDVDRTTPPNDQYFEKPVLGLIDVVPADPTNGDRYATKTDYYTELLRNKIIEYDSAEDQWVVTTPLAGTICPCLGELADGTSVYAFMNGVWRKISTEAV